MSKKGYSKEERGAGGAGFADSGLEMLSQQIEGYHSQDILQAVGISRPFFYRNYCSSWPSWCHIINCDYALPGGAEDRKKPRYEPEEMISFLDMVTIAANTISL